MKKILMATILTLGALALAGTAFAQDFEAEIDCGGVFQPGDMVPLTVRFENQTQQTIPLQVEVRMSVPGLGQFTLANGRFNLGPNEDRDITRRVTLPLSAPNGSYQGSVTASSPDETSFDTCSFQVQ